MGCTLFSFFLSLSLSLSPLWKRTVILVENAGSMRPHMKDYIQKLFGIPSNCIHHINCAKWGSVSRARFFFSSSTITVLPPVVTAPFDDGWSPALKVSPSTPSRLQPRPLPPWLRPRGVTERGSVIQSPLAYHPKHLLFDTGYFDSYENFQQACLTNHPTPYPSLPFKEFLPEFLWQGWDLLLEWKAHFDSILTPQISASVGRLIQILLFISPFASPLWMRKPAIQNSPLLYKQPSRMPTPLFAPSIIS